MTMQVVIPAITGVALAQFSIGAGRGPITLVANGQSGAEVISVQLLTPAGYVNMNDGVLRQFTATINTITLNGPGDYQINKPTTASAASVVLFG